jgi:hypothetical protein
MNEKININPDEIKNSILDGSVKRDGLKVENSETPKFEIGRLGAHEFDPYDTAKTEEEAVDKFLKLVSSLASPTELAIFNISDEPQKPREDLMKKAYSSLRVEIDPNNVSLEQVIDMDTARDLGFALFRGTNTYDYLGQPMTLDEIASMEAQSIFEAKEKQLQTAVGPNGMYVSWDNPESDLAKKYNERVQEYLRKKE